jgi:hypothetical protein
MMLRSGWKTDFLPLLMIILLPLLIIGGALIPGHTLLPADLLSNYAAWQGVVDSQKASNGLLGDDILQFYPWRKLAYEAAQSTGSFPLWNPYELTGQPLVANAQSALYYPPNILLHWFKPEVVVILCAYFNFLMLGIFSYYFCREIKLRRISCLFAAVTTMLSGAAIVYLGNPLVNSMASFPLMLLAGEKIINGKRLIPWILALGVAVALSILGGHPETTFHICFAYGLYFLIRLIVAKPTVRKALSWIGAALAGVFLGLLIGAIQWMPFLDFLLHSATLVEGGRSMGGANALYSADWRFNLTTIVTFLIPNFFGSPITNNYYWPFPNYQNYSEQAVYFGLIPLALSFSLLFNRRLRPQALVLFGISLFFLAVAWRLPGFEVVNHIPPFNLLSNKRMKLFVPMMIAIVAGIGLDNWLDRGDGERSREPHRILALLPPAISIVLFGFILFINKSQPIRDVLASRYPDFIQNTIFRVFNLNQPRILISLIVPVLLMILITLGWRRIISPIVFAFLAVTITVIELTTIGWNFNTVTQQSQIYPAIPIVSLLKNDSQPFRTLSTDLATFPPNAGAAYGTAQVEGYDLPVFKSIFDIYQAQGGDKRSHRQVWSIDFPLVDWLNIRYVISPVPIEKDGYQLVIDQPSYKVYRNTHAYPRATMVYDYQVIEDQDQLLKTMVEDPESLKTRVLFSTPPPDAPPADASSKDENSAEVEFTSYGMDQSRINVTSPRAGFLVITDLYADGWKAKVDGQPTPVLIADYAYRAVYLPAGEHEIEFYYQPVVYTAGKLLTFFGLLVLVSLAIFEIYKVNSLKKQA